MVGKHRKKSIIKTHTHTDHLGTYSHAHTFKKGHRHKGGRSGLGGRTKRR
jgi:hypothetical protein